MKKIAILLLGVLVVSMAAGCGPILDDNIIDLPGSPPQGEGKLPPAEDLLQVMELCGAWSQSLQYLFAVVDHKDNSFWLNQLNQKEIKKVADESIDSCNNFISEYRHCKLDPEYISARDDYIDLTQNLKKSLKDLIAAVGKNNSTDILNSRDEIKEHQRISKVILTRYAASFREGLMQVIGMSEAWSEAFMDLRLIAGKSWAGQIDTEKLKSIAKKSIAGCNKFISKYQVIELQKEYITVMGEYCNLTQDMKKSLQELVEAIDNKDMAVIYGLRSTFQGYFKKGDEFQAHYTEYLQGKVHLFPEVDYPEVALEYLFSVLHIKDMSWLSNYLSQRKQGRKAFSLEKLHGHVENILRDFIPIYNSHRFLNVPDTPFGRYDWTLSSSYRDMLGSSKYFLEALKDLSRAIAANNSQAIEDSLDSIQRNLADINSETSYLNPPR